MGVSGGVECTVMRLGLGHTYGAPDSAGCYRGVFLDVWHSTMSWLFGFPESAAAGAIAWRRDSGAVSRPGAPSAAPRAGLTAIAAAGARIAAGDWVSRLSGPSVGLAGVSGSPHRVRLVSKC